MENQRANFQPWGFLVGKFFLCIAMYGKNGLLKRDMWSTVLLCEYGVQYYYVSTVLLCEYGVQYYYVSTEYNIVFSFFLLFPASLVFFSVIKYSIFSTVFSAGNWKVVTVVFAGNLKQH